jgi:hypothetical protein
MVRTFIVGDGRRRGAQVMDTGSVGPESPNTFRGLAVACTAAVAGLILTGAAIWFGLEVIGFP